MFAAPSDGLLTIDYTFVCEYSPEDPEMPAMSMSGFLNGNPIFEGSESKFQNSFVRWNIDIPITAGTQVTITSLRNNQHSKTTLWTPLAYFRT